MGCYPNGLWSWYWRSGGAGNGSDGRKAFKAPTAIKEVALGMQEAPSVETHLYIILV